MKGCDRMGHTDYVHSDTGCQGVGSLTPGQKNFDFDKAGNILFIRNKTKKICRMENIL